MEIKIILQVLGIVSSLKFGCYASKEHRLIRNLLGSYRRSDIERARPVQEYNTTINIQFGMKLIKTELDTVNNVLTADVWLTCMWKDEYVTWDPEAYKGVSKLGFTTSDIWTPDITIYNGFGDMNIDQSLKAIIMSDGTVLYIPQAKLTIDCTENENGSYSCPMKFGSWIHDGYQLDVVFYGGIEGIDVSSYLKTNKWEVVSTGGHRDVTYYDCCPEPYPSLAFDLTLARKSSRSCQM